MSPQGAAKIRELRLIGQVDEALRLASVELGKNQTADLLAEAIRVLILKDQPANAAALYRAFTANPADGNNLEPEALVRLSLQMNRRSLLENMPVPAGPSWLVELLKTGQDLVANFQPSGLDVAVTNGPAVYNFSGPCPHCKHLQTQAVATSLLVLKRWYCPGCFGSLELTLATVQAYLEDNNRELRGRDYFDLDAPLLDHIRPQMLGEEETENIVRALGQEYVFLLNELIVWHDSLTSRGGGS